MDKVSTARLVYLSNTCESYFQILKTDQEWSRAALPQLHGHGLSHCGNQTVANSNAKKYVSSGQL